MKRFRIITAISLVGFIGLVIGNIYYLHALYDSIKEQTLISVKEAIRRADILEIINRMNTSGRYGKDESFIRMTLSVEGTKNETGGYDYPNIMENMGQTMSAYFHLVEDMDSLFPKRDYKVLDSFFRKELNGIGLNPEIAAIEAFENDSLNDYDNLWPIYYSISKDQGPILKAFISPLDKHILKQMSGIIVTSTFILLIMIFLIWYLLYWVGRLRTIEQMKDDFTHNMTHELKTPVAVAYSAADSMLRYYDQSDEARNRKFLKIIIQKLNYLSGMIENILSMSMERFKTMKLNIKSIEVKPIVIDLAGMIELKTEKPVTFNIDIPNNISVQTDPIHFGNILSNLIDNAIKYSGDSVSIEIKADSYSIAVTDNGVGIDKTHIPYIFDKFYRVSSGDIYETEGYGLGLYYVKQIVDLLGWNIDVVSKPGQGTTFIIKFKRNEKR